MRGVDDSARECHKKRKHRDKCNIFSGAMPILGKKLLSLLCCLFMQVYRPQSRIHLPTDARNEDWQGFDIFQGGAEVDDTGAQQERPSHDRIREARFAASLSTGNQFLIQLVDVWF